MKLGGYADHIAHIDLTAGSIEYKGVPEDRKTADIMVQEVERLNRVITQLLEFAAEPEYIIQLLYDGTYFTADLPPMIFEGRNQFYLVFETETDPKTILQNTERIAKLGTRESLPLLIARALPGIKLEYLPIPPQELPRRAHSTYFKIDHHGDNWTKVQKEKNLALYWDEAPQDLKVQLMTVGRT